MKWLTVFLLGFVILPGLVAAEKSYAAGKIVQVEDKVHTTILYYQVNTPVTRDDPYYEISVQVKDTVYLGVYTPRHAKDLLPAEWIPGADVKVKLEAKRMILLTPGESEIEMPIAKRIVAKAADTPTPSAGKQ